MLQEESNDNLFKSIKDSYLTGVMYYHQLGADINMRNEKHRRRNTPILQALHGELDIVKYLIENGADLTIQDKYNHDLFYSIYETNWARKTINKGELLGPDSFIPFEEYDKTMYDWFNTYEAQKLIIDKNNETIHRINHYGKLHPQIELEYKHLLVANELNLL